MKRLTVILLVMLVITYIPALSQSKIPNSGNEQLLLQLEQEVIKAWMSGDAKKIDQLLTGNYNETIDGRLSNRQQAMQDIKPITGIKYNLRNEKVSLYDNAAVITGFSEIKFDDKNAETIYYAYTDTYIKDQKNWKLAASHSTKVPAWRVRTLDDRELATLTALPCEEEGKLRSMNSDTPTLLRFKNSTSGVITIHWIDYTGQRNKTPNQIRSLKAGQSYDVTTFLTHPFVIVDPNGRCLGIYQPTIKAAMVVIQ